MEKELFKEGENFDKKKPIGDQSALHSESIN
jgi:hypothetical protein